MNSLTPNTTEKTTMNLFNQNINFDKRADGEYEIFDWAHRKEYVLSEMEKFMIESAKNDQETIFCLQEVMPESEADIRKLLEDTHDIYKVVTHPVGRSALT